MMKNKHGWVIKSFLLVILIYLLLLGLWYFLTFGFTLRGLGTTEPAAAASVEAALVPSSENNTEPVSTPVPTPENVPQGGGSVNITFSGSAVVALDEGMVYYSIVSPGPASHNMSVEIYSGEQLLCSSELIPAGEAVKSIKLKDGISDKLELGVFEGKASLSFYDRETGAKADFAAEIPVDVSVVRVYTP